MTSTRRRGLTLVGQSLARIHRAVGLKSDLFAQGLVALLVLPLLARRVLHLLSRAGSAADHE
ncbi:hypothetical protein [Micromonospora sp. NPDC049204]|uniref:hypothetical protein n=1 Tax=unclassified Micromonospora TaxID=2617518 RepID=UPI00340279C2